MFYRKFLAYILVVLYGVPAAIGPHWHSHHHCADSEVACAHSSTTSGITEHSHAVTVTLPLTGTSKILHPQTIAAARTRTTRMIQSK